MTTEKQIEFNKFMSQINRKAKVSECFHRNSDCDERIIRAHSIQNNKILTKLSENGILKQIGQDSFFTYDASDIGRNIATTFTGFCGKHDNDIFKHIEENDFDNSKEHVFLFTYRTLAREYVAKKFSVNLFKELSKINPDYSEGFLLGATNALKYLERYKEIFNNALKENNFTIVKSKVITLDSEYLIAVSSAFCLEYDLNGNLSYDLGELDTRLKILFFNIFPQEGETIVILSYLQEDSDIYDSFTDELSKLDEEKIIEKLNMLICMYCENFVMNPSKWDSMDDTTKTKFVELFIDTINPKESKMLSMKPNFNLFF